MGGRLAIALCLAALAAACTDAPKGDFASGEPDVTLFQIDKAAAPADAEKALRKVLATVPQLRDLRAAQEKAAGGKVRLNLSLQSAPDPSAKLALERESYFVYVNLQGPSGLLKTFTFVVDKGFAHVRAFAADGDTVVTIQEWVEAQGR